jgi:hypothetical protein
LVAQAEHHPLDEHLLVDAVCFTASFLHSEQFSEVSFEQGIDVILVQFPRLLSGKIPTFSRPGHVHIVVVLTAHDDVAKQLALRL